MATADATSNAAVIAALIGVFGIIAAAIITMWQTNRRVGKPNGAGNLSQMSEAMLDKMVEVHEHLGRITVEQELTRSMVEASAAEFREHQREDRENFAKLFKATP